MRKFIKPFENKFGRDERMYGVSLRTTTSTEIAECHKMYLRWGRKKAKQLGSKDWEVTVDYFSNNHAVVRVVVRKKNINA